MKNYEKPTLEVIPLQVEEALANNRKTTYYQVMNVQGSSKIAPFNETVS